jgi:regulator of protease activity HflC (stomatin/prohibitin superfamily)
MGCYSCIQKDESIKISNYSSMVIKHGAGCLCYLPCADIEKIDKINLLANQYIIVTHIQPITVTRKGSDGMTDELVEGDIIEIIPGPCIYTQQDPFATIEGPYYKTDLSANQYVICTNPKTGHKKTIQGPCMYTPEIYEQISEKHNKKSLLNNHFIKVTDLLSGNLRVVSGPIVFTPTPFEQVGGTQNKIELTSTQYVICTCGKTGDKTVIEGPTLYVPKEFEDISGHLNKVTLRNNQYIYIKDQISGKVSTMEGPRVFACTPFEEVSNIHDCLSLTFYQYVWIKNRVTGIIRVEKGPSKIILSPIEQYVVDHGHTVRNALTADANNAIHIRDIVTGTESLITESQIYFPETPNISIIGLRPLIKLAPYQRMVVIDRESNYIFRSGDNSKGFFLPPFCKILTQMWTYGLNDEKKKVEVFDVRFHDMDFKFAVRTNDNVEINMNVNIYWTIKEFEKMIKSTNDPPQDLCNHVRSQILNIASKLTTKELMEFSSLDLIKTIAEEDDDFCDSRGIKISRINITGKKCADPEVENNYLQIIQEKIARIKGIEKQRGENDVRIANVEGEITFEGENYKLLEKKMANRQMENETKGTAEGEKINMFFQGLGKMNIDEKMKIFLELQRSERIQCVTTDIKELIVTPDDINFQLHKIEQSNEKKENE